MESLLPSEIARLVYGYLIDEKCEAAAQLFLETSEFLKECYIAQKKGRKFNTCIMGLCLVDILNLYTDAVCVRKNCKDKSDLSNNVIKELQNVLIEDELSDKSASNRVFLTISIPRKRKSSGSPQKLGRKENEEKVVERKEPEKKKEEMNAESLLTGNQGKLPASNLDHFDLNRKSSGSPEKSGRKENEEKVVESKEPEKKKEEINAESLLPGNQGKLSASKRKSSGSPKKWGRRENEEKLVERKEQEKKKEEINAESSLIGNLGRMCASNLDHFDLNMLQTLLDNTALHKRLAENINKAIDSSGGIKNSRTDEKKIIETVLHSTEADPIFDELLHMLVAQISLRDVKRFIMKSIIINDDPPSSAKLRPIAPKITQSLDNGVKVQVVHTKENPLVETNSSISKRNLRSRKKPVRTVPSKIQSSPSVVVNDKK